MTRTATANPRSAGLSVPAKAAGASGLRQEAKAIRRLLRRLLDGPISLPKLEEPDTATPDHAAGIDRALVQKLVAQGLVRLDGNSLAATGETRAYLRRAMSDQPETRFADQHRAIEPVLEIEGKVRRVLRRNAKASPLQPLIKLRERDGAPFLSEEAIEAGERLAADFDFGGLQPRITASWEPRLSSKLRGQPPASTELSDSRYAARARVSRAVDAMGPELSGVALDICCFGKGLELVERERQWPARSAKLMLRAALLALARHYAPPAPPAKNRHWGADGFRPDIG